MNNYKYTLERKNKYFCPRCNKKKFVRYIDTDTNQHLHTSVGRCDAEVNCGYHYKPKAYFADNDISNDNPSYKPQNKVFVTPAVVKPSFIDVDLFKKSLRINNDILQTIESNYLLKFLVQLFDLETVNTLISKYFIGTSKKWNGACIFWQIDKNFKIRTGKIMLYDPANGKRVKQTPDRITWVHKQVNLQNTEFTLKQCFFGEHLLKDTTKIVAIVESEKTALIASVCYPKYIWLSCGGLGNLTLEKCLILQNREVILYPDAGNKNPTTNKTPFEIWRDKAKEYSHIANFKVNCLIERVATETQRTEGFDVADFLIQEIAKRKISTSAGTSKDIAECTSIEDNSKLLAIFSELEKTFNLIHQPAFTTTLQVNGEIANIHYK